MANGGSIVLTGTSKPLLIIRNNGEDLVSIMGDGTVQYHTDSPPEEAARLFWEALAQWSPIYQYEQYKEDHDRLVRQLDVLLNGKDGAARQAALCDMVSQVQRAVLLRGAPLLVLQAGGFEQWRDEQGFPVTSTQEPLWRRCWEAAQAATLRQPAARVDGDTQEYRLRAMALNYSEGHSWDRLDTEACSKAADEIASLRAALSAQPAPERQGAVFPMPEQQVRLWIDVCNHEPSRQVLRDYLRLRAHPAAPVGVPDEGMVERGAAAIREVANPRVVGDVACIEFAERALKAALSDQPAPERQGEAHQSRTVFQMVKAWGYPWLPCPICKGVEGCDHSYGERAHAALSTDIQAHPAAPVGVPDDTRRLQFVLDRVPHSVLADFGVLPENWRELAEGEAHISDARACIDANLATAPSAPQGVEQSVDYDIDERGHRIWGSENTRG